MNIQERMGESVWNTYKSMAYLVAEVAGGEDRAFDAKLSREKRVKDAKDRIATNASRKELGDAKDEVDQQLQSSWGHAKRSERIGASAQGRITGAMQDRWKEDSTRKSLRARIRAGRKG